MKNKLTKQYLELTKEMCKKFYANVHRDDSEEDSDIDLDFERDCYMIGSSSSRPWAPFGPMDVFEGAYIWSIDDVWTALEREIPKNIILEFYGKHREDYSNEETYYKINLRHYYRQNYDLENYAREQAVEKEESHKKMLETSYLLDDALGVERGTSILSINKQLGETHKE